MLTLPLCIVPACRNVYNTHLYIERERYILVFVYNYTYVHVTEGQYYSINVTVFRVIFHFPFQIIFHRCTLQLSVITVVHFSPCPHTMQPGYTLSPCSSHGGASTGANPNPIPPSLFRSRSTYSMEGGRVVANKGLNSNIPVHLYTIKG